jgi:hypothetical protein
LLLIGRSWHVGLSGPLIVFTRFVFLGTCILDIWSCSLNHVNTVLARSCT